MKEFIQVNQFDKVQFEQGALGHAFAEAYVLRDQSQTGIARIERFKGVREQ